MAVTMGVDKLLTSAKISRGGRKVGTLITATHMTPASRP
jgi:hypothetical protein